ncbi:thiamine phosphate synthase [Candidatus Woesearchaeota archaeon]|nr:thiamine phosphate synthase [Candidatus Woesearchaeota archaeon]
MNIKDALERCRLYFITDSKFSKLSVLQQIEAAIEAGCTVIQYREKDEERKTIKVTAKKIREITKKNDVIFIVNDYLDIACEVEADGLHIGQGDIPYEQARQLLGKNKIIGVSCHTAEQAKEAEQKGADYIGFGPIFHTDTKYYTGSVVGTELLQKTVSAINITIVAIGGINNNNLDQVLKTKPQGIVMISALLEKKNLQLDIKKVISKIKNRTE